MGRDISAGTSGLPITDEEEKLLKLLLRGQQDKQIAYENDIPLHQVKYRLRTLYDKIGVSNRTQAALKARDFLSDNHSFNF